MSEDPIVRTAVDYILDSPAYREPCCIRLRDDKLGKRGELSNQFWAGLEVRISARINNYRRKRIWSIIQERLDEEVEKGLKLSKLYQHALLVERKLPSSVERAVAADSRNALVDSIQACELPVTPELVELLINRNRGKNEPDTMERRTERIVENCVEVALSQERIIRHEFFSYVRNLKVGQWANPPSFFKLMAHAAGECYEEVVANKTTILARIMEELDEEVEKVLKLNNPTYGIVRRIEASFNAPQNFHSPPDLEAALKTNNHTKVMGILKRHYDLGDCDLPTVANMLIGREKLRNQPLPTVAEWISESRPEVERAREEAIRVDRSKLEDIARQLAMGHTGLLAGPIGIAKDFLTNKTVNLTLTEETTMNQNKPLETITYVYGKDVTTLTKDELMEAIKRTNAKIAAFKEVDVISSYIDGEVKELEAVVSFLVSKLDADVLATAKGKK